MLIIVWPNPFPGFAHPLSLWTLINGNIIICLDRPVWHAHPLSMPCNPKQKPGPNMLRNTIIFVCLLLFAFLGTGHAQEGSFSEGTMSRSTIPLPPGQAEAARHANSIANAMPDELIIEVDNNLSCNDCRRRGDCSRRSRKMNHRLRRRIFAPRYATTCRRFRR